MAKVLRILSDPDFTTKGSPLTKEEADQDMIDIWNATLDGKGVTATAAELNRLDGTLATVRANLGLSISSDVQPWEGQRLRATDTPTFAGLTSLGDVISDGGTVGYWSKNNSIPLAARILGQVDNGFNLQTNADGDIVFVTRNTTNTTRATLSGVTGNLNLVNSLSIAGILTPGNVLSVGGAMDITGTLDGVDANFSDDVNIAGSLFASEFVIDQLSIIGGSQLISVARGRIASVTDTGVNTADVTIEDPNGRGATQFVVDDIVWVNKVDIDGFEIRNIRAKVTAIVGVTVSLEGLAGDPANIVVGDVIIQRGNLDLVTNPSRGALIYTTVNEPGAPFTRFLTDVDSEADFTADANNAVQIGNLSTAPTLSNGTVPSGDGFYSDNAFLEGVLVATGGELQTLDINGTLTIASGVGEITTTNSRVSMTDEGMTFDNVGRVVPSFSWRANPVQSEGHNVGCGEFQIADDDATRIVLAENNFEPMVTLIFTAQSNARVACVAWDNSSTPMILFEGVSPPEVGNVNPTGTTGTDGLWGIYSNNSVGSRGLHIENRTGGIQTFRYFTFGYIN